MTNFTKRISFLAFSLLCAGASFAQAKGEFCGIKNAGAL
jgi:hypothetical protein